MKRKAYPKYKFSGVEWLGDVPEHWGVKRARFVLTLNPSKQEVRKYAQDVDVTFLPMESVGEDGSLSIEETRPLAEVSSGYTYFAEGDVTFAKITPCFENGKGAIMRNLLNSFGFGTTELTVLREGKNLNNIFLYYVTISNEFRKNGEAWMYDADADAADAAAYAAAAAADTAAYATADADAAAYAAAAAAADAAAYATTAADAAAYAYAAAYAAAAYAAADARRKAREENQQMTADIVRATINPTWI